MSAFFAILGFWETLAVLLVVSLIFHFLSPASGASGKKPVRNELIVWLARGFDVGRLPKGPGTWGSIVGIVWFAVLVSFGRLDVYLLGTVLGMIISVWICDQAEKILKQHDPSSVVLDEIIALPICFFPWVIYLWRENDSMPVLHDFFAGKAWLGVMAVFALFRLCDIWKPGPIGKIQNLRGGLGVTADDVLAGITVAIVVTVFLAIRH